MTRSRVVATVLVFFMVCGPWSRAMAETVLYTIEFVASGTVGTKSFADEPFVFAGVTDSQTIDQLNAAITYTPSDVPKLVSALSVVAGLAFIAASFFKFHQHKQNPPQLWLEIEMSFAPPLTRPVLRDGSLATLSIDSIQYGRLQLRTQKLP